MTIEEKYIVDQFRENFANIKERIAIYGIGKNTELILDTFPEVPIIGLMDASAREDFVFGKKLLNDSEVVGYVDIILIVARKAVQSIIYPRIKKYIKSGIRIVNIEGNEILDKEYLPCMIPEWEIGIEEIKKQIDQYDCISFDLFDTLIMRSFLIPSDVFETVIRCNQIPQAEELIKVRNLAEKEGRALKNIDEIYEVIERKCNLNYSEREKLKNLELEMEKRCIVPRKRMVELLDYARKQGKKIIILSDMYYGKKELKSICEQAGIGVWEGEIISSCEIKATKEEGKAYQYLKNFTGTDSILHIGDNRINDYERAKEAGLGVIHILSAYEMLLHSSLASLLSDTNSYEKRCLLALTIVKIFNDPFVLNSSKGKIHLKDFDEFGYFWGAIFYCFLCWLIEQAETYGIEQMLLPGRDGYLIEKALQLFNPKFDYKYIVASRRAYELAVITDIEKVKEVIAKDYKGSKKDLYKTRFHIDISDNEGTEEKIADLILAEALYQRRYLIAYFEQMGVCNNDKKLNRGIVDCVASGTVQACLEKLLDCRLQGFYFGIMQPQKENLDIIGAFGKISNYNIKSSVLEHYLLIENMLIESENGTFIGFYNGEMMFEDNIPSDKLCFIQEGILEYIRQAKKMLGDKVCDFPFCDEVISGMFNGKVDVSESIKEVFLYDDSYIGEADKVRIWE